MIKLDGEVLKKILHLDADASKDDVMAKISELSEMNDRIYSCIDRDCIFCHECGQRLKGE